MKFNDNNWKTLQDEGENLSSEKKIRKSTCSGTSDKKLKSDEIKKILYIDANKLYGYAVGEFLPYAEIKFDEIVELEDILNTPNDSDIGYFVEADIKYPDNVKQN